MNERDARAVVRKRSGGRCEVCGGAGYEFSHRRTRAVRDEHQFCGCNALLACRTDHARMHASPTEARSKGLHVSRFVDLPAQVPVFLMGRWWTLYCDGSYVMVAANRVDTSGGYPRIDGKL